MPSRSGCEAEETQEHEDQKMNANADIRPLRQVATHDLYHAVHKGIRLANARMLIALGQADAQDDASIAGVLEQLSAHLDLSLAHLTHENEKIHAVVEARIPGGADHAGEDHDHHLAAFSELRALADAVAMAGTGADRAASLRRLYQRFALFMADDLTHMHEEETRLMPLIAAHYSQDEVLAIEQGIVSCIEPATMAAFLRVMLAGASRSERVEMVTGMQAAMPEAAFAGLFAAVAGPDWVCGDWDGLERALC